MSFVDRIVMLDTDGSHFISALRTATGTTLGVLVYVFGPFGLYGLYSILAGLFSVHFICGNNTVQKILFDCIASIVLALSVAFSMHHWFILQTILVSLGGSLTLYAFWCERCWGLVLLFATLFGVIGFGPATLAGSLCGVVTHIILPWNNNGWFKKQLPAVIRRQVSGKLRWLGNTPLLLDFSILRLVDKKYIFDFHARLFRLAEKHHQLYGHLKNVRSNENDGLDALAELLIVVSCWPVSCADPQNIAQIGELRHKVCLLLSAVFDQSGRNAVAERENGFRCIVQLIDEAETKSCHPHIALFTATMRQLVSLSQRPLLNGEARI